VRKGASDEAGDGRGALVGVQLAVGQAGVVVDDRVRELVAPACALLGVGLVAFAGDGMAGPLEASEALGVHVQQITRAGPLVAAHCGAWAARKA
jgi:hypothetical protein